jgi:hypothetical protein
MVHLVVAEFQKRLEFYADNKLIALVRDVFLKAAKKMSDAVRIS